MKLFYKTDDLLKVMRNEKGVYRVQDVSEDAQITVRQINPRTGEYIGKRLIKLDQSMFIRYRGTDNG